MLEKVRGPNPSVSAPIHVFILYFGMVSTVEPLMMDNRINFRVLARMNEKSGSKHEMLKSVLRIFHDTTYVIQ